MSITVSKFIEGVESIYEEKPAYELGCDGSNGKCDCIGMVRGGSERAGAKDLQNMRGTNQAARRAIEDLQPLKSEGQLSLGDVVLKTRDPNDATMPLPDRYRRGGADYDPTLGETNFTHIGTVTGIDPLVITHMTSPTAKKDKSVKGWSYTGRLPWVEHGGGGETQKGVVTAPSGSTVNLRRQPSKSAALVERIPIGSVCDIHEERGEWDRISVNGKHGWMMSQYIDKTSSSPDILYEVTIPGLDLTQATAVANNYPGSIIKEMTR